MKFLLCVLFSINTVLFAQISPGDLTKAHEKLEGMSNCTKCHEIGEKVLNSKCLSCHSEINELIKQNRGYHSSPDVKGKSCAACHNEHHGRGFRIVNFNKDIFDHSKTGFSLKGKHSSSLCSDCHNAKNIPAAGSKKTGWLGLSVSCNSCHADFHKGTLGSSCESCHNTEKFRPSLFDHNNAKFQLTGSHQKILCIKCHPVEKRNGTDFQKFKGIAFSTCENCHIDVHGGRLGKECKSCHNTNSFRSVNQGAFDHSKTSFPLTGKHNSVNCNLCHKNGFAVKLAFTKCTDCHNDYHNSEFTINNVVTDCGKCHAETGFSPSHFTIEDHNQLKFQLTGSHLAVPCSGCHSRNEKWKFRSIGLECGDCHKNVHGNEINDKYLAETGCRNCHSEIGWRSVKFDHSRTDFPLLGKHAQQECRNCHITKPGMVHKFASLQSYCTGCHNDVHAGQFGSGVNEECSRCHSFDDWKPVKFDHNKTRFTLEGAHSRLKCSQCHKPVTENNISFIKYKVTDFKCAACHS